MSDFLGFFNHVFNPEWIFLYFGNTALYVLLFIIFSETSLFIGFLLPGDSLLFTAGIFGKHLSKNFYNMPFFIIILLVALSAILGNVIGYIFGYKYGTMLYKKKTSWIFKKKQFILAKLFYKKYKTSALIISRFLPILRTFAPIVAGVVRINFKEFMTYNIAGAFIWTFSIMLAGHYLDKIFPKLKSNLEWVILILILMTTLPIIVKLITTNNRSKSSKKSSY